MAAEPPLIFLIEDNEADVHLVRASLDEHGVAHQLRVMKDGEQAARFIDRIDTDQSARQRLPALIILDLNLPKRDGREVLKHLRASPRCAEVPVIVVTSSDSPADRDATAALGARAYFRKPSQLEEFMRLGSLIKELIDN